MKMSSFVALCCLFFSSLSSADVTHQLFRKVAVFPIADANFSSSEDAWWQMREALTKDQRFLVASRRFMINRGVFQPRRSLKPADAIILGKILDAEALMVTMLQDRTLKMIVYSGENGSVLWESNLELHPAIPAADQLIRASQKMVVDFMLAIPYQGFQVLDESSGKAVIDGSEGKEAWIFHGLNSGLEVGEPVQWIEVSGDAGQAFFSSGVRVQLVGEGKVLELKGNLARVGVDKIRDLKDLRENALVRFPREMAKLKAQFTGEEKGSSLSSEYLSSEMKEPSELERGHHPTSTTLAWLGNFALLVLLAF